MIVFGMESLLTKYFLAALAPVRPIQLVVLPAPPSYVTTSFYRANPLMITPSSVAELAASMHIPVLYLVRWQDIHTHLPVDAKIVVCCFPRKFPDWICARGCYNVHPSLLPMLRGPDPLFYTARGDAPACITIHRMDSGYDTGPIVVQQLVDDRECHDEASYISAHATLAAQLCGNDDIFTLPLRPQSDVVASYAPIPQHSAYVLPSSWPAQRIRRFIQFTDLRQMSYWVPDLQCWVDSLADAIRVGVPCRDGILT